MALGIVSQDEFKKELGIIASVVDLKHGRGNTSAVPNSIRKLAASDALDGESNSSVAKSYGLSESSVSAYKNGDTSTSSYDEGKNAELKKHVTSERDKINNTALTKIARALDSLTDDKILNLKARDAASLAKDVSSVVKNLESSESDASRNMTQQVQVVIFSPQMKQENDYEIIEVKE